MSNETESQEYYWPCVRGYRHMEPKRAVEEWLVSTEPQTEKGGLPKHTRVLHVLKAEAIMQAFINRMELAVIRNSTIAWKVGTPLPGKNNPNQPLHEWEDDNVYPPQ